MYRVSRYGTNTPVAYFDHNKEYILEIIGRIGLCDLVLYVFVGTTKRNTPFPITITNRLGGFHI